MSKKEIYKQKNIQFLKDLPAEEGIQSLPCGIYYKVLLSGEGKVSPTVRSIVSVHYKGYLIDGKEFDNSYKRNCPEAFRLCEVIDGWQLARQLMHVGDKWVIYIPSEMGYGPKASGPIPGFSTLIYEVELLGIG